MLIIRRLNLAAATHVHLVEPHWNPMVEAQAAARVDRLDQKKPIYIYRYVVKDSIEEVCKWTLRIRNSGWQTLQRIQAMQRSKIQLAELSNSQKILTENSSNNTETIEVWKAYMPQYWARLAHTSIGSWDSPTVILIFGMIFLVAQKTSHESLKYL